MYDMEIVCGHFVNLWMLYADRYVKTKLSPPHNIYITVVVLAMPTSELFKEKFYKNKHGAPDTFQSLKDKISAKRAEGERRKLAQEEARRKKEAARLAVIEEKQTKAIGRCLQDARDHVNKFVDHYWVGIPDDGGCVINMADFFHTQPDISLDVIAGKVKDLLVAEGFRHVTTEVLIEHNEATGAPTFSEGGGTRPAYVEIEEEPHVIQPMRLSNWRVEIKINGLLQSLL